MKILQVNVVYQKGSTGKITYDLHKGLLAAKIESVVCYGRGTLVRETGVYKTCPEWYSKLNNILSRVTGIMYGGCFFSTDRLISIIKKEQPDIVHLQCINGYFVNIYRLVNWLKKNRVKTVLTLHAEFMYTANCGHALECEKWKTGCGNCPRNREETKSLFWDNTACSWRKMKAAFDGFDDLTVTSVSPWLMARAKQSPILADKKHIVVFNGVNTNIFHPYDTTELRRKITCENREIVFHATPTFSTDPDHFKGGWYVCELARRMPRIQFVVAGTVAKAENVPENVKLLGKVSDQIELAQYYSMADVTLLTSKKETFSMVAAESLCCGTPVVGFKAGGPEQIAIPEYSRFTEYADLAGIQSLVENIVFLKKRAEEISIRANERYSKQKMIDSFIQEYNSISFGSRFDKELTKE